MSTRRLGCNQYGHAPGCGHPVDRGAESEVTLAPVAFDQSLSEREIADERGRARWTLGRSVAVEDFDAGALRAGDTIAVPDGYGGFEPHRVTAEPRLNTDWEGGHRVQVQRTEEPYDTKTLYTQGAPVRLVRLGGETPVVEVPGDSLAQSLFEARRARDEADRRLHEALEEPRPRLGAHVDAVMLPQFANDWRRRRARRREQEYHQYKDRLAAIQQASREAEAKVTALEEAVRQQAERGPR